MRAEVPRPIRYRDIFGVILGNLLESYDFVIYSFFAVQIGHALFPTASTLNSLLMALGTFGAGFITRPIGAIVIGAYADRRGRRPAMLLCFGLMGGSILTLALTPSYSAIGLAAPVIAIVARMTQGFSLGGEVGSNTAFLIEASPPAKRAIFLSWQGVGQLVALFTGSIIGLALTTFMSTAALNAYGWRIAFLLGVLTLPVGVWLRNALPETLDDDSDEVTPPAREEIARPSSRSALAKQEWRVLVLGFVLVGSGAIGSYISVYIVSYAQDALGLSGHAGFLAEMMSGVASVPAILLGGWLSDRYGRWPVNVGGNLLNLLAIIPIFEWVVRAHSETVLVLGMAALGFISCLNTGSFYASLGESLPKRIRVSGYGIIYSVGVALLGGTTQLVATWLIRITGSSMAPAWYLMAATAVAQIAFMLLPESAPRRLARKSRRQAWR
jgi:MHS family citrate/tricarballylate:H+ symporter-like MFS transporter